MGAKKKEYSVLKSCSGKWNKRKMRQLLSRAKQRCENIKSNSYKYYGARGIRFLLPDSDASFLWERDGGEHLKNPSIDRFDSSKDYVRGNCRFIELRENSKLSHRGRGSSGYRHRLCYQTTLGGAILAKYYSLSEASRHTGISRSTINKVCNRLQGRKQTNGFVFKYGD